MLVCSKAAELNTTYHVHGGTFALQLTELNLERNKMNTEKVNLENQLEAEQEYILNKLHKQVIMHNPYDFCWAHTMRDSVEHPGDGLCIKPLLKFASLE